MKIQKNQFKMRVPGHIWECPPKSREKQGTDICGSGPGERRSQSPGSLRCRYSALALPHYSRSNRGQESQLQSPHLKQSLRTPGLTHLARWHHNPKEAAKRAVKAELT
jgi:hypothetical protein